MDKMGLQIIFELEKNSEFCGSWLEANYYLI